MRIDFFEEYPTDESLSRARTLAPGTIVYLAARSRMEFKQARKRLIAIRPDIEAAYWPVLPESYWISPFSFPHELDRLEAELAAQAEEQLLVLLDLELPILSPRLFVENIRHYVSNRARIRSILALSGKGNVRFATAEYWWTVVLPLLARFLGVAYSTQRFGHTRIIMCYSSMMRPWLWRGLKPLLRFGFLRDSSTAVGLGTTAPGVFGNEPTLSPEALREDLTYAKNLGKDVVIFRLGGLTDEHATILHEIRR